LVYFLSNDTDSLYEGNSTVVAPNTVPSAPPSSGAVGVVRMDLWAWVVLASVLTLASPLVF